MSDDGTLVLSDESKTRKVGISVYEAQVARLRQVAETEMGEDGIPIWNVSEHTMSDVVGLPSRRCINIWMTTDSQMFAFGHMGARMLNEWVMFGVNMSIQWDHVMGVWVCTMGAVEAPK